MLLKSGYDTSKVAEKTKLSLSISLPFMVMLTGIRKDLKNLTQVILPFDFNVINY